MQEENALQGKEVVLKKQKLLPDRPGVYRMISSEGRVLYVGKAKNLKKRVLSYTRPEKLSFRIAQMVSLVCDLVVIECATEAEAFLLENELIKKYSPPYNILLKDDKSYPFLFLNMKGDFPKLMKYRGRQKEKGFYFGPFASVDNLNKTLQFLQRAFQLRTCSESQFSNRSRPCLLYQIKKCSAPCTGLISKKEYAKNVKQVRDFLSGKTVDLQKSLTQKMYLESENQNYEQALRLRNQIKSLNELQAQKGENSSNLDADIFAIAERHETYAVQIFFYRKGMNNGSSCLFVQEKNQDKGTVLEALLGQFYLKNPLPKEVLVSEPLAQKKLLEEVFSNKRESKVQISIPQKGFRKHLLEQALLNAAESLSRHLLEKGIKQEDWKKFSLLLGCENVNIVEVYDNSHLRGTFSVGAMIAASQNGFEKKRYRRFDIDTQKVNPEDDFAMMKHVLMRRLARGVKEENLPDVMMIDGGKGQLQKAYESVKSFGLEDKIILVGVAKGENRNAGNEKLVFTNGKEVYLGNHSSVLHLIERLRDEAHRFAIGTHRAKRQKGLLKGELEEISGVGRKRKKALLEYFGSVKGVKDASLSELRQVEGISESFAKKIYTFFHS